MFANRGDFVFNSPIKSPV